MKNWPFIYLASGSPRRHEILTQMGVSHEVLRIPSPPGEDEPRLPGEAPHDYVMRTAHDKADRALQWLHGRPQYTQAPVLTSDTTVILGDRILPKPDNIHHAAQLLAELSGVRHEVRTAVVLATGQQRWSRVSVSQVQFRKLTTEDIDAYCATGEPMGKAGGYGIQGKAGIFVQHLSGSFTGVMGLPMYETAELLDILTSHQSG